MSVEKLAAVRLQPERYEKLATMAEDDCRTLSDELRWLIDSEWGRRNAPARELVDTAGAYVVKTTNG